VSACRSGVNPGVTEGAVGKPSRRRLKDVVRPASLSWVMPKVVIRGTKGTAASPLRNLFYVNSLVVRNESFPTTNHDVRKWLKSRT
jgi:hypothetical protein